MKKISILIIACVLLLSMSACGRTNDTQNESNTQNNTESNTDTHEHRNGQNDVMPDIVPDVIPDMEQNVPDPDIKGNDSQNEEKGSGATGEEIMPDTPDSNR